LSVQEGLDLITLTRKMIPNAQRIMVAGGRELLFGAEQAKIFQAGANSIVVGDYLTTSGRETNKDLQMLVDLSLEVAKTRHDA